MTLTERMKTESGTVGNYKWTVEWFRSTRCAGEKFKPKVYVHKRAGRWPLRYWSEVYSSVWRSCYSAADVANDYEVKNRARLKAKQFQEQAEEIHE